ncbi:MAG: xylulokinase [Pseudomonadota bacterium]
MFIGLDLGTSGVRALLVDGQGVPAAVADVPLDVSRPHPGWSEQNPRDWITACATALGQLDLSGVQGIAVAGHMHGAVLIGEDDAPLRPCILWNDTRAAAEAAALDTDAARDISGTIVFPGFTAPKLAWVANNEPDIFSATRRVVLPKDYVVHWLTGHWTTEMSDASGTAWLDTGARAWSDTLLEAGGITRAQMPSLHEGTDVVGRARAETGLPKGCKVIAGAADNAAAACGAGVLGEGDGFVSLGTSGVVLLGRDGYAPSPTTAVHTFCHALPGRWYQMGVTLACTDSLNWLARITGQTPQALTEGLVAGVPQEPQFFPYLSGERTPHNDADIRGGFVGLDVRNGPQDMARAVLEGTSLALMHSLSALGGGASRLLAIGGGTASDAWLQTLANALGVPLDVPEDGAFGAALGAARLALCGATGTAPEHVMTRPPIARHILPEHQDAWADARARFTLAYPKLKAFT